MIYLYPLQRNWELGDHKVTCTIGLRRPVITGTLRDSRR